ncbi:MAG: phosphopantothenoylcysteine decarboxylase [Planctomycetes bacterium]|nr:phosphopantothenoylcysteine decarboxylase [Planctomycetota bacterium]
MLITAGPTHEAMDNVRFIGNRSSGRMGITLAEAAKRAGWHVTLLLGPTNLLPSDEIPVRPFVSAADLENMLNSEFPNCDVLIMAAAVGDFRPAERASVKIARNADGLTLHLVPTPDLVAHCARGKRQDQFIVAFALEEPQHLERRALEKLRRKGVDAIVGNPIDTIGAETIAPAVYDSSEKQVTLSKQSTITKEEFSDALIAWIDSKTRLQSR